MNVDTLDKQILRELAKRIRDISADPVQAERKRVWSRINSLKRCRIPLLLRFNGLYANEVVPYDTLQTIDDTARTFEHRMRMEIWRWDNVDDDCVTEPVVYYDSRIDNPKLLAPNKSRPETDGLGAYHVVPVVEKESDIDRIIIDPECSYDRDGTARLREWVETVFDGILTPVRRTRLPNAQFDYLCEIRGMDNVFTDMCERPEWLEEVMRRLYGLCADKAKRLESDGALALNNTSQPVVNGGQGYIEDMPADGFDPGRVRLKDIWGWSVAQASVSISPEMHERFITQFDREYHALFGLTSAACCETVDRKMHLYRTIPNLRRISICAWNDYALAAEGIGADYVYSVKPSAVTISQPAWNPEQDMEGLRSILEKSRGCHVEIIHHEIATCHGQPERLTQWFRSARKLTEEFSV